MKKKQHKLKLNLERIKVIDKRLTPEELAAVGGGAPGTTGTHSAGTGSSYNYTQETC